MLILTDEHFIARGTLRRSYRHPSEDGLCVKVSDATPLAIKRQQRELAYYEALKRSGVSFQYIADYKGKVLTNHGPGYMYERVCDESGDAAQTLLTLLPGRTDLQNSLLEELRRLGNFLLENRVFFHDCLVGHILCCVGSGSAGDRVSLKIVDGLGDTVLIPWLNYVKPLAESKVVRRWNRSLIDPLCKRFDWLDPGRLAIG
jgi:hypothetical protein